MKLEAAIAAEDGCDEGDERKKKELPEVVIFFETPLFVSPS